MSFLQFIKEKALTIFLIIFSLLTIEIFFMAYQTSQFIKIYIPVVILTSYLIGLLYEYFKKRKYYKKLQNILDELS